MAFTAREDTRGETGRPRFSGHWTFFLPRGIRAVLASASLFALASCSATSDPILDLGITPEQLAQSENADATADAPEVGVSDDDGTDSGSDARQRVATTLRETQDGTETEPDETATTTEAPGAGQAAASAGATPAASDGETAAGEDGEPAETPETANGEKRRSFLSAFFSPSPTRPANSATRAIDETTAPAQPPAQPDAAAGDEAVADNPEEADGAAAAPETGERGKTRPIVELASNEPSQAPLFSADALPGVRGGDSLFEITHKSGIDDDSTIDVYEDVGSYQVASAGGMARLAPNGLLVQREGVNVGCFKPNLLRALKTIERHYGKRLVVTSGYRSPSHNRRVNGARHSLHMSCAAADIQMAGVSKWELAKFARSIPGRGGVGTYCHTNSIHVDVGPQRDWNWRCRRR